MSEELNKQLTALAGRLGVSVEHLWGVLIRQAYIDGVSSLATTFVCLLLGVVIVYSFLNLRRKLNDTPQKE